MANTIEHLVGRAAELESIAGALDEARRGLPVPLLVAGEPGIGKTRLLTVLSSQAVESGFTVLTGSGSELERDLPFWLFVDALDEHVGDLDPLAIARLGDEVRSELAQMLPSLSGLRVPGEPTVQDERYRAHHAVRELLERLAARQPLVLVLDDVHWADAASAELLAGLLRRPPDAAVLLVMAARPRQLGERLAGAIERADRQGRITRISLTSLTRSEAGELLGSAVGGTRVDALYGEAGGNPFYLEQLARSPGVAGAQGAGPDLDEFGVPPAVVASLTEELAFLSPDTLRVLRGAAVSGDPFEPDLAAVAAGAGEVAAMEAFDDLLATDLVRATDVPRRFRFRHPLVRRTVYATAPGGWLLGAHERCAQALTARGASAPACAHHVEFAAHHGDRAAIAVLKEAGASAMMRAPASAARWFSAALRLLPDDALAEERVELLLPRARAYAVIGRLSESHDDLLESIALVPADAGDQRVPLIAACAGVEQLLGHHKAAHARLEAALGDLPDAATPEAATLMLELATDALFGREWESLSDWAGRASATAHEIGNRPLIAAAVAMLTLGRAMAGDIPRAEQSHAEACAVIAALSDEELSARADGAAFLAAAETYLDRYEEARAHAARAYKLGRATGHMHPSVIPTLGTAHFMLGMLAEAAEILDMGVESARAADVSQGIAWSLHNRAYLAWLTGEVSDGLAMAAEAMERAARLDDNIVSAWAGLIFAVLSLPGGSSEEALEALLKAARGDRLPAIAGSWRVMGLDVLARTYIALGRGDEAARAANLAAEQASVLGLPVATAWGRRAQAAVALDSGDHAAAAELAIASASVAESAGVVVEGAFSRVLAGRALAGYGASDAAAAEFEHAAEVFERCGAERHRDAAEQELRRLGRHVHRRTRRGSAEAGGIGALTGRELEVADLVVGRRTNPEIAAELFLSRKTVETHLRNIFRKVDVSSRMELAQAMDNAGRARPARDR